MQSVSARGGLDFRNVNVNINFCRYFPAKLSSVGMVMVRFWSVLPERRPVHLLEEPEDGAELGGGAVRAFSELVGVRRGRLAELQGDFFHQCRIAVFSIKPTFLSSPKRP